MNTIMHRENLPNRELIRAGHELAAAMSNDTPIIEIAKLVTKLATALDVQTALVQQMSTGVIPDGYALVPQEMCLSAEAMEALCYHCGDGGHMFGEFTDGVLFVGETDPEDGKKVYGLHIVTADYPEEGCATICEFLPVLREGKAGEESV
ncbi:hypothetical protein STW0522KLE44_42110 [Klebsiella sp. STW0522-44]|nr:hypothetical protein STW0522KLE44_42110 [Klebsiella sp. STW0522-44]